MLRNKHIAAFGVGDPSGRHSPVWVVWADNPVHNSRAKSDVYVVSRSLFGSFKTSLHASGQCYTGWTTEWVRANPQAGIREKRRKAVQWQRPAPVGGVTRIFRVLIPSNGLARFTNAPSQIGAPTTWIPDPGHGFMVEFNFILTQPSLTGLEIEDADSVNKGVVGHFYLSSGENLIIYWRVVRVPPQLNSEIGKAKEPLKTLSLAVLENESTRILLFADMHDDGGKALIDVSW